ncbi:Cysteine-rich membrane protein 2 [Spironucleus salmonicida]|uniref:Cysteine-rich membrane protein 2 n=1 Tax=Spironucleus salmonicida TaxID=348837 RepID=V6LRU0_9EUKA|nr:Cysteine-rich membrane protein 2 [Spironucleus salmonicida]|eukprot:EST46978.1 Cysteine-rich membrane protein 2 [Spironucleus salmonicida]
MFVLTLQHLQNCPTLNQSSHIDFYGFYINDTHIQLEIPTKFPEIKISEFPDMSNAMKFIQSGKDGSFYCYNENSKFQRLDACNILTIQFPEANFIHTLVEKDGVFFEIKNFYYETFHNIGNFEIISEVLFLGDEIIAKIPQLSTNLKFQIDTIGYFIQNTLIQTAYCNSQQIPVVDAKITFSNLCKTIQFTLLNGQNVDFQLKLENTVYYNYIYSPGDIKTNLIVGLGDVCKIVQEHIFEALKSNFSCPKNQTLIEDTCILDCLLENNCPSICPENHENIDGACYDCGINGHLVEGQCEQIECEVGQVLIQGECTELECGEFEEWNGAQCIAIICKKYSIIIDHSCVECDLDEIVNGNKCQKLICGDFEIIHQHICISCGIGELVENGYCVEIICKENQELLGDQCQDIVCGNNQILENGMCVSCAENEIIVLGKCKENPCKEGQQLIGIFCVDPTCPIGTVFQNGKCEQIICDIGWILVGNRCEPILCQEGEIFINGQCIENEIEACEEGQIFEDGECVDGAVAIGVVLGLIGVIGALGNLV